MRGLLSVISTVSHDIGMEDFRDLDRSWDSHEERGLSFEGRDFFI